MSRRYNIRWTQSDNDELKKAVSNFNAKLNRLKKKNPDKINIYPEKVTVKEIKELVRTRNDLKREINALRRFTRRGAEIEVEVPTNKYNLKTTKWQKEEMTRRTGVINRRRKKRLEEIQNIEMTSGGEGLGYTKGQFGMGKIQEVELRPLNAFYPTMSRKDLKAKWRTIKLESQSDYFDETDRALRENYKKALLQNFNENDIKDVLEAIDKMSPQEFRNKFMAMGGNFEMAYPEDEVYEEYVERLKSDIIPNKKPKTNVNKGKKAKKGKKKKTK